MFGDSLVCPAGRGGGGGWGKVGDKISLLCLLTPRPLGLWKQGREVVQEQASALSRVLPGQGGFSHQVLGCEEEQLPQHARTALDADTKKSRQPLSLKIKSRRASLVLNKT